MWRVVTLSGCMALLLFGVGCGPKETWVRAARGTFDKVAPAHRKYVEADKDLTADQKKNRLLLLDTWKARVVEWEKEVE